MASLLDQLVLIFLYISSLGMTEGCTQGDVRIEGLGRVEFCSDGVWGAVCLDSATSPWSDKNAQVVCKQLMFSGALNSVLPNMELAPSAGTPYHLGSVQCYGNETTLGQCTSTSITQCTSESAAAVACRPKIASHLDVRLVGSPMNGAGAVEIYAGVGSGWVSACPDSNVWSNDIANAVCVQLGYEAGETMTFMLMESSIAQPRQVIIQNCTGAHTLPECEFDLSSSPCSAASNMYAGVNCDSSSLPDGTVRLFGVKGLNNAEGRVEIVYGGRWGTVCRDAFWGFNSGETVCRQLGYEIESINQVDVKPFGNYAGVSNNRPIWLGRLQCNSNDNRLGSCGRQDPAIGSVVHCMDHSFNNDAAVNCNRTTSSQGVSITQTVIYVNSIIAFIMVYAATVL